MDACEETNSMDAVANTRELNGREPASSPGKVSYHGTGRRPRWHGYTAFVLSGGGARGALQVGALQALFERGIQPDVIVGTSIGAWNAGVLGQDPTLAGVRRIEEIWRSLSPALVMLGREPSRHAPTQAVNGALMLAAARRVGRGYASLYGDAGAKALAARCLGELTFADLLLPVYIVAANITTGARRAFSAGPLAPAVIASSAIPGIFPPVTIEDDVYVDGGALDNLNVDVALAAGARRLFILDVGYDEHPEGEAHWRTALAQTNAPSRSATLPTSLSASAHPLAVLLERTAQVMSHYHAERELARIPPGIETYVLRLSTGAGENALAFGKAVEWMDAGYAAACAQLEARFPSAKSTKPGSGSLIVERADPGRGDLAKLRV